MPPPGDIHKVIWAAEPQVQDYLWTIWETLGRVSEINNLEWDRDVNFHDKEVTLWTRKKRGGHLTARLIPMTSRLEEILVRRYEERDPAMPWVFWHSYYDSRTGEHRQGPYVSRQKLMPKLCKKAGVKPFGYHALGHSGASMMDHANVHISLIQSVLGHESRTTTEIYLHELKGVRLQGIKTYERARAETLKEAMGRLEEAHGKK